MTHITRWDALHDLRGAQDQMNQMDKSPVGARDREAPQSGTGADVVTVESPGIKVEDLEIAPGLVETGVPPFH